SGWATMFGTISNTWWHIFTDSAGASLKWGFDGTSLRVGGTGLATASRTDGFGILFGTNASTATGVGAIGVYGASYGNTTYFTSNTGVQGIGGTYGVM